MQQKSWQLNNGFYAWTHFDTVSYLRMAAGLCLNPRQHIHMRVPEHAL